VIEAVQQVVLITETITHNLIGVIDLILNEHGKAYSGGEMGAECTIDVFMRATIR